MDYHNLQAILDGRVSGHFCEWPLIRPELRYLFDELSRYKAAWEELKEYIQQPDKLDSLKYNWKLDAIEQKHGIGEAE